MPRKAFIIPTKSNSNAAPTSVPSIPKVFPAKKTPYTLRLQNDQNRQAVVDGEVLVSTQPERRLFQRYKKKEKIKANGRSETWKENHALFIAEKIQKGKGPRKRDDEPNERSEYSGVVLITS